MVAVGIGEVGPLTAQLLRPLIHVVHKGLHAPVHRNGQDLGHLVARGEEQAVQVLLQGVGISHLNFGGGAALGHLQGLRRGGDGGVQGQLPRVHRLQHQQGGHHLGDAGGVHLVIGPLVIEHLVIGGIDEDGVAAGEARVLHRGGGHGQEQGGQKDHRRQKAGKTAFFHWAILHMYDIIEKNLRRTAGINIL